MNRGGSRAAAHWPFRRMCAAGLLMAEAFACQAQLLPALQDEAMLRDPAVAGALAQAQAAAERVQQAEAAFGPTAALTLGKTETRYWEAPAFVLRRFDGKQAALQINQPLFRTALRPALDATRAQLQQAEAQLTQVRGEATVRLLEAVFDLLKSRDMLVFSRAQRLAAEEQLASARRSFKVGTATVIDVREAEAKIDTVDAQALAAQADIDLKHQLVTELVGRPVPELLARGLTGERLPQMVAAGIAEWLADAQLGNPQLAAARRALEAAEAEIDKARQGHAPTADLTYNYTMSSDSGTVTSLFPRRGDISQVGVNVNIPLFASGATASRVRETQALRDKVQSDVDAARRTVQVAVRQNFTTALSSVGLVRGLETAVHSLEAALQANRRGYEVGMKVNADVLESQSKLFESRRDLSKVRYDAWLSYYRLKSFAGRLSGSDMDELDQLLAHEVPVPPRGRGRDPAPGLSR